VDRTRWVNKHDLAEHKHVYGIGTLALMNSLHGLLNCKIGGLECRVVTTE